MKTVDKAFVNELLKQSVPNASNKATMALEYSLMGGGKRIRPLLLLNTAKAVGKRLSKNAQKLAVALECIHTYSLIHDDLPCMDNDDIRRGKRTCHMQYGEAFALLAGDALLNLAVETVFQGSFNKNYISACQFLFKMSGVYGMIHGQCLDLLASGRDLQEANQIALHKTGDLFRASIVCGAMCAGANSQEIAIFDEIATKFGICYQVIDDLLDAEKCEQSFLDIMSEKECRAYAEDLTNQVKALCDSLPYDLQFIKDIADRNFSRKF